MAFFVDHRVFQELETQKMISTSRESRGLYHLERGSEAVACSSSISYVDIHCRLGIRLYKI